MFLDFATWNKKEKNCVKGFACKYSCISRNRECKDPLEGQAKTYAEYLKMQSAKGRGKRTEFAQKWSASWGDSPDDLMAVVNGLDDPEEKGPISETNRSSHYKDDAIFMNYSPDDADRGQAIWRHEYGHKIDDDLGSLLLKDTDPVNDILAKNGITTADLRSLAANEPARMRAIGEDIKRAAGFNPNDRSVTIAEIAQGKRGYFSGSEQFTKAIDEDSAYLVRQKESASDIYRKEVDDNLDKYKSTADRLLGGKPITDANKAAVGKAILANRVAAETSVEVVKRLKDKYLGGRDPKNTEESNLLKSKGEEERISLLTEKLSSQNSLVGDLVKSNPDIVKDPSLRTTLYQALKAPRDPEVVAKIAEKALRSDGLGQDLIGSITKNKVGFGHSDDYYAKRENANKTETFANINAFHAVSKGRPLATRVLEELSPSTYNSYKKALTDAQKALQPIP